MKAKHIQLLEIAQVRRLQMAASEAKVAIAQERRAELEASLKQVSGQQRDALMAWGRHAEGGRLDLTLSTAWSDLFRQAGAEMNAIKGELQVAQADLDEARDKWRLCQARSEASDSEVSKFEAKARRRADELALMAAADLWPHLGGLE